MFFRKLSIWTMLDSSDAPMTKAISPYQKSVLISARFVLFIKLPLLLPTYVRSKIFTKFKSVRFVNGSVFLLLFVRMTCQMTT